MTKSPLSGMLLVMNNPGGTDTRVIRAARALAREAGRIRFAAPVSFVYNPLVYARVPHEAYLRMFAAAPKRVVFLGMNPGPWGMTQTGVPFGDVPSVREWLGINGAVSQPRRFHEKHPVQGFDCSRREVSGTRFWGLMREQYGTPEAFAADAFVANYCPLMFLDESGRNLTPDKLRAEDRGRLDVLCDRFLLAVIAALSPAWVVGIGAFAERRARDLLAASPEPQPLGRPAEHGSPARYSARRGPRAAAGSKGDGGSNGGAALRVGSLPHPSPANPQANRGWAGLARAVLERQGVWSSTVLRARGAPARGVPRRPP